MRCFHSKKLYMVLFMLMCVTTSAWAKDGVLAVNVNQSLSVSAYQVTRASIANPDIADIVIISDRELLLVGKKQGATTLRIWTANGEGYAYEVRVGNLDTASSAQIRKLLGYLDVKVSVIGNTVVLEGFVADQNEKQRAEQIAKAYSGNVINLLEVTNPKQVRLEVKVLEISSSKTNELGIQYGNIVDNDGTLIMGTPGIFMMGQSVGNAQTGHSWSNFGSYADIGATISALIKNGDAELLSAPNMVTMSGEKANILIGGEIPIPVAYDNNKVSVEWKEYGIKLDIEPLVDSRERIHSKVKAEVSDIDNATTHAVDLGGNIKIPALRTRRAESVVDMLSGSTMAIGGLISSEESKQITKFPLLGDLPVIGRFFRHTAKSKERKEIVILVTPTLVSEGDFPKMSNSMKKFQERTKNEPEDLPVPAKDDIKKADTGKEVLTVKAKVEENAQKNNQVQQERKNA